jgi:hypothetical protein
LPASFWSPICFLTILSLLPKAGRVGVAACSNLERFSRIVVAKYLRITPLAKTSGFRHRPRPRPSEHPKPINYLSIDVDRVQVWLLGDGLCGKIRYKAACDLDFSLGLG